MFEPKLQTIVELLCSEGCQQVTVYIQAIESGVLPECMDTLQEHECLLVLKELKSIMSVYTRCET